MVLAKGPDCDKDLTKEPIEPYYDITSGRIKARDTSLGGDDGIGVATQLAIMNNPSITHGPIEHLFTVNEEDQPGKCVIEDLKVNELTAKYYINIDGEELDSLVFGGAGCTTMKYDCEIEQKNNPGKGAYTVGIYGLTGGHSGVNINRPHINAICFLAQCAYDFGHLNQIEFNLCHFEGGPMNNSLPVYAKMTLAMEPKQFEKFKRFCTNQLIIAKRVAQGFEDDAQLDFAKAEETPDKIYSFDVTRRILMFAFLAPNKVFTSNSKTGNMFSSSNLGYINTEHGRLHVDFKIRSFMDGEIQKTVRRIDALGRLLGFTNFQQTGQLFAFMNDLTQNSLSRIYGKNYKKVIGKDIKTEAVCGGLECAIICVKNPQMISNTISINTTLYNCHSPNEGFNVNDTVKF